MATLYVFPDTNLFIQCRPLNELDWSLWPDSSEIHLVVTRPVQREIDGQKTVATTASAGAPGRPTACFARS